MEKHILFCNCRGERIHPEVKDKIYKHLETLPVKCTKLSDLCGLVQHNQRQLNELLRNEADFLVIGCYQRAMDLLFAQIRDDEKNPFVFTHVNMIDTSADKVIQKINKFCRNHRGDALHEEIRESTGWPAWYPVIDSERCTACGQCADFCLFGVYEKAEDHVKVVNPEGCKTNCPACARICPDIAIIFPKYKNGGAIGGAEDFSMKAEQLRQVQDVESILGGDIYATLEKRKVKRQSIIRDDALRKAYKERNAALGESETN